MKQPKSDVKYSSPENKNRASINNILDRLNISNRTCKTWTRLRVCYEASCNYGALTLLVSDTAGPSSGESYTSKGLIRKMKKTGLFTFVLLDISGPSSWNHLLVIPRFQLKLPCPVSILIES